MLDAKYKDFEEIGRHPAFKLGYEHPELVDALADFGNAVFEHQDMPQESPYADTWLAFDSDIPTRIFSLHKQENLLDTLVNVALELEVEVYLMATHPDSGQTETVWQSEPYPEQQLRRLTSTLHHFEEDASALVLDILSRPTRERVRVLLD